MEIIRKDFSDVMLRFTVKSLHGSFNLIIGDEIPFAAREEDIDYLNKICGSYKEMYNEEITYSFREGLTFFKKKDNSFSGANG